MLIAGTTRWLSVTKIALWFSAYEARSPGAMLDSRISHRDSVNFRPPRPTDMTDELSLGYATM